jgi:hypothetical protein
VPREGGGRCIENPPSAPRPALYDGTEEVHVMRDSQQPPLLFRVTGEATPGPSRSDRGASTRPLNSAGREGTREFNARLAARRVSGV